MKPKPEREQEDTARAAEETEANDEAEMTASEDETLARAAPDPDDCYQPRVTD